MNKHEMKAAVAATVESLEIRQQFSAGLTPNALAPAGRRVVTRPAGNTGTGFFVSGTHVYDANGNPFVIRGFNHTTRNGNDAKNLAAIAEFPKTGANAVRTTFGTYGVGATPAMRQAIAEQYIAEGIVPIVEDHSATNGSSLSQLQAVVDRWLLPENVKWLKKDERNVILNIANEWGPDSPTWRDAYISSISRLRAAGVNALIMVDAGGSGQNVHTLETWAQDVLDADPQHNVVFSIHLYNNWRTEGATDVGTSPYINGAPWDIKTEMTQLHDADLPVVAGEFSMTGGFDVPYDTHRAMEIFNGLGMGWLAWSWNQNGNPIHDMLANNAGYQYDSDADLNAFGQLVVNDPTLGLKATARPATTLRPGTINGYLIGAAGGKTIYIDDNANGKLDAGERSTITTADSTFSLKNLPQGVFTLRVADRASTPTAVALAGGDTVRVGLTVGQSAAPASLSGLLFNDLNRDGMRDAGESTLAGHTVYLDLNHDGTRNSNEPTRTTDPAGRYTFTGLAAGTYRVGTVLPAGYRRTNAVLPLTLTAGQRLLNLAVAIGRPPAVGSITGTFFIDRNHDGVRQTNEGGQPGKSVYVDLNDNGRFDAGEPTTTTQNGTYLFTRLEPGTYTVRRDAAGWDVTTPGATVTVTAFQTVTADPIGAVEKPGSISGVVYNDANGDGKIAGKETPAAGVKVYIDANGNGVYNSGEATVTTDDNGSFKFSGLWSGTYAVRAVPPDGQSLTTGTASIALATNQTLTGVVLGIGTAVTTPPPPPTGVISGIYFNDANKDRRLGAGETRVAGAKVYIDANDDGIFDAGDPSCVTAADGSFRFTGLNAGTYELRAVVTGPYAIDTAIYDVILSPNQKFTTARFGRVPSLTRQPVVQTLQAEKAGLINGTVASASYGGYNGLGFADFAGSGSAVQWTFSRPAAGKVSVSFRYANGSTANRPLTLMLNGVSVGNVAFPNTGGWTTWGTTAPLVLTLPAGTNVLKAVATGSGPNVDQVALTSISNAGTLSGAAFADHNADGKYDGGDAPLKVTAVFLDADNDGVRDSNEMSVITDAGGRFNFSGLSAGTYHVRRLLTAGESYSTSPVDVTLGDGQTRNGLLLGTKAA